MNKIGSSRVIEINNTGKAKSGLPFIKDDYIGTASKLKLILTDEELSKSISEWDKSLLDDKKDKRYYLVKSNPPFYDQLFVKLKMKYCSESKRNIDVLKTALVINKKTVDEEVTLSKLNEYLSMCI